jgi:catechol 2,3-dioxygenase-like lactoylglutathione lyase family enzyme
VPFTLKYVALHVSDLRAAEDYYAKVFAMTLLFRESQQDADTWHTLRPEDDWDDADAAGTTIDMVALRRDAFVLALFRGTPAPGAVFELCVGLELEEIGAVRSRLPHSTNVIESQPDSLRFVDPFGFRWAVQRTDAMFRSSGEIAGRWLDPRS